LSEKPAGETPNTELQRVLRLANAAVMTALAGGVVCLAVLFGSRIVDLFG
jgi:hypothetical protein